MIVLGPTVEIAAVCDGGFHRVDGYAGTNDGKELQYLEHDIGCSVGLCFHIGRSPESGQSNVTVTVPKGMVSIDFKTTPVSSTHVSPLKVPMGISSSEV